MAKVKETAPAILPAFEITAPSGFNETRDEKVAFYAARIAALSKARDDVKAQVGAAYKDDHLYVKSPDRWHKVDTVMLLSSVACYTKIDGEFAPCESRMDAPAKDDHQWAEHIIGLVLCYTSEGVIPAVASMRKTACNFLKKLAEANIKQQSPFALMGVIRVDPKTGRSGKAAGMAYTVLTCEVTPVDAPHVKMLQEFTARGDSQSVLETIKQRYHSECDKMKSMGVKR